MLLHPSASHEPLSLAHCCLIPSAVIAMCQDTLCVNYSVLDFSKIQYLEWQVGPVKSQHVSDFNFSFLVDSKL